MNLVDGRPTFVGSVDAHAFVPGPRPEGLAGDPHVVLVGRARRHAAAALRPGSPRFAISATVTMRPWRCGRSIGRNDGGAGTGGSLGHH